MKRTFISFQTDRVLREVPDLRKDFCNFKENHTKGDADGFADAVTVWINKPHVLNRRLCGSRIESIVYYSTGDDDTQLQTSFESVLTTVLNNEPPDKTLVDTEQDGFCKEVPSLSSIPEGRGVVVIRDIHPKRDDTHPVVREVICYDGTMKSAWFCPITDTYKHKSVEASRNLCYQLVHCVLDKKPRILCRICKTEKDSWCSGTESTEIEPGNDEPDPLTSNTEPADSELWKPEPRPLTANTEPVLKQMEQADIGYELATTTIEPDTSIILSDHWLKHILLPKIANWSEQGKLETTVKSLRLVRIDQYNTLYNQLKVKYGKKFVECWPEKTDPAKFVYEDVGIATYLLLIWEQERNEKKLTEKQSFVDLGCGNGLLVHILSAEGHPGVGLDVRKRNIWDLYGPETHLKEQTVIPSCDSLFQQYDWLIGNHSDELTPWIPVMAARSSYTCRYFVLPCCPFDFDRKFNKKVSGQSSYRCFLDWVAEVGQICGFQVEEDTLRIPSVKRVCFIGKTRTYSQGEEHPIDAKRTMYIKRRCDKRGLKGGNQDFTANDNKSATNNKLSNSNQNNDCPSDSKKQRLDDQQWTSTFKPRESKERTRNCQHVKKEIKELIVNKVFTRVMESENAEVRQTADGRSWHKGGSVPLSEVAQMFDREVLRELKSECGGLQTLLRNHNMVFNVSGGKVQLRDLTLSQPFSKASQLGQTKKIKTLLCWFHLHHPDGCPRSRDTCLFAHGEEDLLTCEKNTLSDSQNK
ncbi:LOW QUALITY PROTEIN: probable tRNA (uracil-O(2)-)-methyltransferase [Pecten maximus]|uniref:LOW QUALITY PROTEIN: probable tRNA (uracil-O(2)-)-methyltransferase n=1 Tax=Pecten maximus TaxID=6579 RepID=UPI0014588536|nr:LOW QUALITY PROTEIN: probable tRNA (uracil-O(2)-)-methyltransferase [Pecten maximus]